MTCLKSYEGLSLTVYNDEAGNPTIGYGHKIRDGEDFSAGITEEQAAELLRQDAQEAMDGVRELVKMDLNQDQFDALTSFVYNVGRGNFAGSTLLKNLNAGTVTEENFTDWHFAGGKASEGLLNRRKDEYSLFANGTSTRCPN